MVFFCCSSGGKNSTGSEREISKQSTDGTGNEKRWAAIWEIQWKRETICWQGKLICSFYSWINFSACRGYVKLTDCETWINFSAEVMLNGLIDCETWINSSAHKAI